MTSLRNHRVIIASLFLPTTAVPGESNPPTPSIHAQDPDPAPPQLTAKSNGSSNPPFRHQPSKSLGGSPPLKSIVDDLKVRLHPRRVFASWLTIPASPEPQHPSPHPQPGTRTTRSPGLPTSQVRGSMAPPQTVQAPTPVAHRPRHRPCFHPCPPSTAR